MTTGYEPDYAHRYTSPTHFTTLLHYTMKPQTRKDSESSDRTDEFVRMFLHALQNDEIARSLREAVGVHEQLATLHREVTSIRAVVKEREATIDTLHKEVVTLKQHHDELEQYSRRNSVRLSGLPEMQNENVVDLVMKVINEDMAVTPPLAIEEIDRIHRVGKQDGGRPRPILIKFATYRSQRRVISERKFLNPQKRTERRQTLGEMLPAVAAAGAWQQHPDQRMPDTRPYSLHE